LQLNLFLECLKALARDAQQICAWLQRRRNKFTFAIGGQDHCSRQVSAVDLNLRSDNHGAGGIVYRARNSLAEGGDRQQKTKEKQYGFGALEQTDDCTLLARGFEHEDLPSQTTLYGMQSMHAQNATMQGWWGDPATLNRMMLRQRPDSVKEKCRR
jgi:hypothetical protein